MIRVFLDAPGRIGEAVRLSPEEAHYLQTVRRARAGEPVELVDPEGRRFRAVVPSSATAPLVLASEEAPAPASDGIELLLAPPEASGLLAALDAACTLGVHRVQLVETERSARRLPGRERLAKVLRSAQRQCGRPRPPEVVAARPLDVVLAATAGRRFVATPGEHARELHGGRGSASIPASILLGPEGGLAAGELAAALRHDFVPLGLGPWILRTEVAVTAAVTRVRFA